MNTAVNKVFVTCWTYNQAKYIKDTMDGFCLQHTTFPFICGIIDDASDDGEPELIQSYIECNFEMQGNEYYRYDETDDYRREFVQHKSNKNCFFVVVYLKYNHYQIKKAKVPYIFEWYNRADYQALCEGDDYWTDPLKLQKQVDFMENHPNHSLCFCSHQNLYPNGGEKVVKRYEKDVVECPMKDIILGGGNYMATNTMLYRHSMYKPFQSWAIDCPIGDVPMMLTLANNGLVGFLADVMCVYRITSSGSWTSKMSQSFILRLKHNRKIIKMWRRFDKWSEKKYHKLVSLKIYNNKKEIIKDAIVTIITPFKKK